MIADIDDEPFKRSKWNGQGAIRSWQFSNCLLASIGTFKSSWQHRSLKSQGCCRPPGPTTPKIRRCEINGLKNSWQFPYLRVGNFCSANVRLCRSRKTITFRGKHLQHSRHSFRSHTYFVGGLYVGPDLAIVAVAADAGDVVFAASSLGHAA
jgi:hypothetical protein